MENPSGSTEVTMRFALALLAVLLAPSLSFAQSNTVRGCVVEGPEGVLLRASGGARQTFDSYNLVNGGERFRLVGDDDLLEEIARRAGQEVQVTGRINPDPPRAIAAPPIFRPPGGGNFPGVGRPPGPQGRSPFNPRVSVRQRDSRRPATEDVILVEEYRAVRPTCRDPERVRR
jgi:hypothetical protein